MHLLDLVHCKLCHKWGAAGRNIIAEMIFIKRDFSEDRRCAKPNPSARLLITCTFKLTRKS